MSGLTREDIRRFEQRLRDRREALRQTLHAELLAARREDYLELAGQVHDIGDESVAELLMGVTLSGRERELEEMRDAEAALGRLRAGTFGVCIDCDADIARERLEVYPTAKRCLACQQRYERTRRGAKDPTPSL